MSLLKRSYPIAALLARTRACTCQPSRSGRWQPSRSRRSDDLTLLLWTPPTAADCGARLLVRRSTRHETLAAGSVGARIEAAAEIATTYGVKTRPNRRSVLRGKWILSASRGLV